MALVRCTCLTEMSTEDGRASLSVLVADPACGYVVHRLADVSEGPGALDLLP
jgi:hypothetical protein